MISCTKPLVSVIIKNQSKYDSPMTATIAADIEAENQKDKAKENSAETEGDGGRDEDDDQEDEDEDDDPKQERPVQKPALSEYERTKQRNIEQNNELLRSMGLANGSKSVLKPDEPDKPVKGKGKGKQTSSGKKKNVVAEKRTSPRHQ